MTIQTKALAKQQKLVNSLLNDLVKQFKGLREIITTLKKQLNKVFNQPIKKVSVAFNTLKKKVLSESLLEASSDNNLTKADVSIIKRLGKVFYSAILAMFRPFAIGLKTLKSLAAPKPIIIITIYALLWSYSSTMLYKLLNHLEIEDMDRSTKKFFSMFVVSLAVKPILETTMRAIASKQKNEIDRDLYLKALTLVKLGNMINERIHSKDFNLLKIGAISTTLDVVVNELQINYGNKPAVWLVGGLLSAAGNWAHYNETTLVIIEKGIVNGSIKSPFIDTEGLTLNIVKPWLKTKAYKKSKNQVKDYLYNYNEYSKYRIVKYLAKKIPWNKKEFAPLKPVINEFLATGSVKKPLLKKTMTNRLALGTKFKQFNAELSTVPMFSAAKDFLEKKEYKIISGIVTRKLLDKLSTAKSRELIRKLVESLPKD